MFFFYFSLLTTSLLNMSIPNFWNYTIFCDISLGCEFRKIRKILIFRNSRSLIDPDIQSAHRNFTNGNYWKTDKGLVSTMWMVHAVIL